ATQGAPWPGALHDAQAVARVCREHDRLLVLDAITAVGVHPLPQDEWGVDVIVCGSQKGLMAPPGLATVSIAPQARGRIDGDRLARCYFDLRRYRKQAPTGDPPWTAPVSLVLAVQEALRMIFDEGLDQVYARHRRVALATRAGARALGLELFPRDPSHAVTAVRAPAGMDAGVIIKHLKTAHGITVAGGQDRLKGQIVRVGHMGNSDAADNLGFLGPLEETMLALGLPVKPGAAAAAAVGELFPQLEPARAGRP